MIARVLGLLILLWPVPLVMMLALAHAAPPLVLALLAALGVAWPCWLVGVIERRKGRGA